MLKTDMKQNSPLGAAAACRFIEVPLCYQETEYTCGIASLQSILARYGMYYRQSALADLLHSQPIIGTDYKSILYLAELLGLHGLLRENLCIEDLRRYIDSGTPPVLIIQAWRLDDDIDYCLDFKNAHYIVACGYNNRGIYAMDPNILGNYGFITYPELMTRWHAVDKDSVRHLQSALIIDNKKYPVKYCQDAVKVIR
jgi:ABC-type bacteriocin/lantibiotic exporter with double-glycine peptidase domain